MTTRTGRFREILTGMVIIRKEVSERERESREFVSVGSILIKTGCGLYFE